MKKKKINKINYNIMILTNEHVYYSKIFLLSITIETMDDYIGNIFRKSILKLIYGLNQL